MTPPRESEARTIASNLWKMIYCDDEHKIWDIDCLHSALLSFGQKEYERAVKEICGIIGHKWVSNGEQSSWRNDLVEEILKLLEQKGE